MQKMEHFNFESIAESPAVRPPPHLNYSVSISSKESRQVSPFHCSPFDIHVDIQYIKLRAKHSVAKGTVYRFNLWRVLISSCIANSFPNDEE